MKRLKVTLKPLTGFSSELLGETLFGQICWQIRLNCGEMRLKELLQGYLSGEPYLIVSDAFPKGHLPMPAFPSSFWRPTDEGLKEMKKRVWMDIQSLNQDIKDWKKYACSDSSLSQTSILTHNTINRETGTTGTGQFAPFNSSVDFYHQDSAIDVYLLLKEESEQEVLDAFKALGISGFGRDASTGLGKFSIENVEQIVWEDQSGSYLTLASTDLTGLSLAEPSFYKTRVHFGRHGSFYAISQNPFKRPLLLAARGAVITLKEDAPLQWIGRGINNISKSYPETVHQGYSMVYPLGNVQFEG